LLATVSRITSSDRQIIARVPATINQPAINVNCHAKRVTKLERGRLAIEQWLTVEREAVAVGRLLGRPTDDNQRNDHDNYDHRRNSGCGNLPQAALASQVPTRTEGR